MEMSDSTHDYIFVCECPEAMRSACHREIFYKEYKGKRYCVLHYPSKDKSKEFERALSEKIKNEDFDFLGVWFPYAISFKDIFSKRVYFNDAVFSEEVDFNHAQFAEPAFFINTKFNKKVGFDGTKFELAVFEGAHFEEIVLFDHAEFKGEAYFTAAKFKHSAGFRGTQFSALAIFDKAQFNEHVQFNNAIFNGAANFQGTQFIKKEDSSGEGASDLYYQTGDSEKINEVFAKIRWVCFAGARFKDSVIFAGNKFRDLGLTFAEAIFEKPERVMFSSVTLYPHSFFKVDTRRLNFFDIHWPILSKKSRINVFTLYFEREALVFSASLHLKEPPVERWLGYLGIIFRQLAVNAEENNRYEEAAGFRYLAMNVQRMGADSATPILNKGSIDLFSLTWWYWLLSGYGERVSRAFAWLVVIWVLFAFIYWSGDATWWQTKQTGRIAAESNAGENQASVTSMSLTFPEALIYSIGVSALQKPEPLPANKRAKAFVLLETLLGPLQVAFLILAIRRKFIR
jgi:uncharacterized protein YjbI with pentapeptide repeats